MLMLIPAPSLGAPYPPCSSWQVVELVPSLASDYPCYWEPPRPSDHLQPGFLPWTQDSFLVSKNKLATAALFIARPGFLSQVFLPHTEMFISFFTCALLLRPFPSQPELGG